MYELNICSLTTDIFHVVENNFQSVILSRISNGKSRVF